MPKYESLESAGERWGVHARTIRRMIADGLITGYRVPAGGRLLRVIPAEVDAAMEPVPTTSGAA
jgi:excisionase family DNA binding protein